jgi:DNA adenine methylase
MQHVSVSPPKPFLKWVGGKRQLIPVISRHLPRNIQTYYEPFVGAGALLLNIPHPRQLVINDLNAELINCYQVIQKSPQALLQALSRHENTPEYFYALRALDRQPEAFAKLTAVEQAARTIYLNKTCFNGLYRVNRKGQFNSPFGRYRNPNIADEKGILAVHHFLTHKPVRILNQDFEKAVQGARAGDFVYFDPPYDPLSSTASFTGYQQDGFGRLEQKRLARLVHDLTRRGCRVMLSNSSTDFICSLYKDFEVMKVPATRRINAVATKRGVVDEVLIMNYKLLA